MHKHIEDVVKREGLTGWYLDEMLHEIRWNDLKLNVSPTTGVTIPPLKSGQTGINLPVSASGLSTHYRPIRYDKSQPPMILLNACFICGTNMLPATTLADKEGQEYLTLGLCPQCGFFQHTRRPPRKWYADLYRMNWDAEAREGITGSSMSAIKNAVSPHVLDAVYSYCRPGQKVLEIGAGWGNSLHAFKMAGFNCYGIEATDHRSDHIRNQLGIPCVTGEAEKVPIGESFFIPESFDLIYSFHALEHVYNTREVIEHIYSLLKPNGYIYFSVPTYYSENLTRNTHDISHTCSFSHSNFEYLLQTIGFDIVRLDNDPLNATILARKAPTLDKKQRESKLQWMASWLPYRGLAYILEKSGLVRLPWQMGQDARLELDWFADAWGDYVSHLRLDYIFPKEESFKLDAIRAVVLKREPLDLLTDILPIRYVSFLRGGPLVLLMMELDARAEHPGGAYGLGSDLENSLSLSVLSDKMPGNSDLSHVIHTHLASNLKSHCFHRPPLF